MKTLMSGFSALWDESVIAFKPWPVRLFWKTWCVRGGGGRVWGEVWLVGQKLGDLPEIS